MRHYFAPIRKCIAWILAPLFPARCVFCRKVLEHGAVCDACEKELPWIKSHGDKIQFVDGAYAPFNYTDSVVDSIRRYKFMRLSAYSKPLSKYMIDCIDKNIYGEFDIITWVPISAKRMKERGFDQSYLLAEEIAEHFHLPLIPTLNKVRHTERQSSKKNAAERRANVIGAYKVFDADDVIGKRILLVDDVITTGATVSECARMLKSAGARKVLCVSVAKAKKSKKKN